MLEPAAPPFRDVFTPEEPAAEVARHSLLAAPGEAAHGIPVIARG